MRLWRKIRAWLGQDGLAEEMRAHREMIEERLRAEGLPAVEARARAAREFGPLATAIEGSRSEWSFAWAEALWRDMRYAWRALARDKAFAATAVLTLGVGLALASVAFTLFNAYVLRSFAVRDPDSLYSVRWLGPQNFVSIHPWRDYEELRGRKDVFDDVLASREVSVGGATRHWSGQLVSGNYFRMLGARTQMGRAIEGGDTDVVVLSHGAWQSAFGGDPEALGKTVLRGRAFEVVGVASPEFAGLNESPPDFWAPIGMLPVFRPSEDQVGVEVIARVRQGVSRQRAEAALGAMAERSRPGLRPLLESRATAAPFTPLMLVFFAPVILALGLVLATCCANVANMLLARGLARQREIGIRLSVGAGRGRLVRQLLTEALVIAALAGATGFALAKAAMDGGQRLFFATAAPEFARLVRLHSLAPDFRVFLFALGTATAAAIGAALLPALQATRPHLALALRGEFGSRFRATRLRDALVVLQVVVCTVLLACGALLYRRADVFQMRDTGMRQTGVISLSGDGRPAEFLQELTARPDVAAAAVAARAPWFGRLDRAMVIPGGRRDAVRAGFNLVSPAYFKVMGIGLTAGRDFTAEEARAGAPVAIVSEATARAFWPGEDPVGKTIRGVESRERFLANLPVRGEIRVVGVAKNVIQGWVFEGDDAACV